MIWEKSKQKKSKERNDLKNSYMCSNSDLPDAPRLQIFKETFGSLENITEQWYKENKSAPILLTHYFVTR